MCGIFGCIKNKNSDINIKNIILVAVNLLKNRGYDSCGLYLNNLNDLEHLFKYGIDGKLIEQKDKDDIFLTKAIQHLPTLLIARVLFLLLYIFLMYQYL